MARRRAWHGDPPATPQEARRRLLDITRDLVERVGRAKAGLSDVAEAAGVTRQTVYRYFDDVDDLFDSAAALAGGGFHHRMRAHVLQQPTLPARLTECLVFCALAIPDDPHLASLATDSARFPVETALGLGFIQEEIVALSDGDVRLSSADRDELAELMLRLLQSFLSDPGVPRAQEALRAFLQRWLVPMIEARLRDPAAPG